MYSNIESQYRKTCETAHLFDHICNLHEDVTTDYIQITKLVSMCRTAGLKTRLICNHDGLKLEVYDSNDKYLCAVHNESSDELFEPNLWNDCDGYETAQEAFDVWWASVQDFM